MSNMPDINKKFVNSLLPIELVAKIRAKARERKVSTTDLIVWVLDRELERVELRPEDYEWIASEVRKNMMKRTGKNRKGSSND